MLTTTDGGETYTSHASENGYTTSNTDPLAGNPNQNGCQATYDNGITGTSGSYAAGTEATDRKTGNTPDTVFLADSYDISDLAGEAQRRAAVQLRHRPGPGPARLVHRRRQGHRPRRPAAAPRDVWPPTSRPAADPTTRRSSTAAAGRT